MKYKSKEEAIKDHVDNYRSDGVAKKKGHINERDYLRFKFAFDLVPINSVVLDVGCNTGALALPLMNEKKCLVRGIDVVPELVEKAKKNGVFAQVGEAEKLPFKNNNFDVVICCEVLEHLFNPEDAIIEAKRVLKEDGIYIITIPHYEAHKDKPLGDYHQQNIKEQYINEVFYKHFGENNYSVGGIPFTEEYCKSITKTEKEANLLLKKPYWLGAVAIKK